ncbi:uncharacterized protein LOC106649231 isoform X1 [Trichogramma pretiosum]|uniref:uncharacterized protein LOC106649231 isoform X1 n=1 Tax=Trichogramma pretiosum TaxID=7493 RepID=UPI0006C95130|nr:uncharacterized protein LOC106649231 isoform X1 [Trichogramma pretiosum]XP_014222018.1 uncharacterized protein LOC106649231 isoform X1 [Trichogramma pretiosum]
MRYYRLWIYACNTVLLCSTLGFIAVVSKSLIFTGDPRRLLVPGLPKAYDPTTLYAYLALTIQLGIVQILGCTAARQLNINLLNAYWLLLLALLFGDAVMGIAWIYRFEKICNDLRSSLRQKLKVEYSRNMKFSLYWDRLQKEFSCCGVTGPLDFGTTWPQSCCSSLQFPDFIYIQHFEEETISNLTNVNKFSKINVNLTDSCSYPFSQGCEEQLMKWLEKTADLLFVLGFCVISFTKLCFLGILRYEIREMIQKIKLLEELPFQNACSMQQMVTKHGASSSSQSSQTRQQTQLIEISINNGNVDKRLNLPSITTLSGTGQKSFCHHSSGLTIHKQISNGNNIQEMSTESDTNSHCALILEEPTPPVYHRGALFHSEQLFLKNDFEMSEIEKRNPSKHLSLHSSDFDENQSNLKTSVVVTSSK